MYICQGVNCIPAESHADPALQTIKREGREGKKGAFNAIEGKEIKGKKK